MKRYMVTGTQPVLGDKAPGSQFEMDMDDGQERFLLGIGAIAVLTNPPAPKKAEKAPEPPEKPSSDAPAEVEDKSAEAKRETKVPKHKPKAT